MTSAKISWTRIILEGAVIVGSILLAFAIDAGWEQRKDREREVAYLRMLQADARATLENNRRFSANADSADWMGARLVQAYYERELPPRDSLSLWFSRVEGLWLVQATLGTAQALVTTGDLELIRNDFLRAAVPAYLREMEFFEYLEESATERWRAASLELGRHAEIALVVLERMTWAERDSLAAADALANFPAGALRPLDPPDVEAFVRDREIHRALLRLNRAKRSMRLSRGQMRSESERFLQQVEAVLTDLGQSHDD